MYRRPQLFAFSWQIASLILRLVLERKNIVPELCQITKKSVYLLRRTKADYHRLWIKLLAITDKARSGIFSIGEKKFSRLVISYVTYCKKKKGSIIRLILVGK